MELLKWFEKNGFSSVSEGAEKLTEELGIKVRSYDDRHVFNYCQVTSPKTDPVVMECRGVILSEDLKVMCRGFDRFFNLGEAPEITGRVDLSRAFVMEKLDGSLAKVYHDGSAWQVATRGTAYAEGENYTGKTFRDLFVRGFGCSSMEELREKFDRRLLIGWTYVFEFTSPDNRVVTPYSKDRMYLIGAREKQGDFVELQPQFLRALKDVLCEGPDCLSVHVPEMFKIDDKEVLRMAANDLGGLREGFVVHDPVSGVRVKVKSDQYVAAHRIRGETRLTPRRIVDLVVTNEVDEYLAYFPEDKGKVDPYAQGWEEMKADMQETYENFKSVEDQKEFALSVKHLPYSGVLFQARAKGQSPERALASRSSTQRANMLVSYLGEK